MQHLQHSILVRPQERSASACAVALRPFDLCGRPQQTAEERQSHVIAVLGSLCSSVSNFSSTHCRVRCPFDRIETPVPTSISANLPVNRTVIELLNGASAAPSPSSSASAGATSAGAAAAAGGGCVRFYFLGCKRGSCAVFFVCTAGQKCGAPNCEQRGVCSCAACDPDQLLCDGCYAKIHEHMGSVMLQKHSKVRNHNNRSFLSRASFSSQPLSLVCSTWHLRSSRCV